MRLAPRQTPRTGFELVVTSMLDINFLLIMFFMMTAQFQRQTLAHLDLPQEQGEREQPDESGLVVNVTAGGEIVVTGQTVGMDELRVRVEEQVKLHAGKSDDPLKLMVRADRNADTRHLNRVVSMLHEAGVGIIRVATEVPL